MSVNFYQTTEQHIPEDCSLLWTTGLQFLWTASFSIRLESYFFSFRLPKIIKCYNVVDDIRLILLHLSNSKNSYSRNKIYIRLCIRNWLTVINLIFINIWFIFWNNVYQTVVVHSVRYVDILLQTGAFVPELLQTSTLWNCMHIIELNFISWQT